MTANNLFALMVSIFYKMILQAYFVTYGKKMQRQQNG